MATSTFISLTFLALLLSGAPLFLAIAVSTTLSLALIDTGAGFSDLLAILTTGNPALIEGSEGSSTVAYALASIPQEIFDKTYSMPVMIAIPLFTLAGTIITEGSISTRLINIIKALFGFFPAGLALAALFGCAFFAAISGSSAVTIMAIGGVLYPAMKRDGYNDKFALGLITTAGAIGILAPPSLPLIIYGAVSRAEVDKLFKAGVVPILVCIGCLAVWAIYAALRGNIQCQRFSSKEVLSALRQGFWALLFPLVLLGVIYGGVATPTEASAFAVLYAVIIEVLVYKTVKWKQLPRLTVETLVLVGGILMILLMSLSFTAYLTEQQVPDKMTEIMKQYVSTQTGFLIAVNLMLLVVGFLMDMFSAILIVSPLIVPVAQAYGVDLVHLGIIMVINLEIGFLHPPFGLNLFVASNFFRRPSSEIMLASLPFVVMLFVALGLITFVPSLSLWLVHLAR